MEDIDGQELLGLVVLDGLRVLVVEDEELDVLGYDLGEDLEVDGDVLAPGEEILELVVGEVVLLAELGEVGDVLEGEVLVVVLVADDDGVFEALDEEVVD